MRTRLEELRAQKYEMLKRRNEDIMKKNWSNLPSPKLISAPSGDLLD